MEEDASVDSIERLREIAPVSEAQADVRAGRVVTYQAVKAWVDSLDTPWNWRVCRASTVLALRLAPVIIRNGHGVIFEVDPGTGRNETLGDVMILRIFGPGMR